MTYAEDGLDDALGVWLPQARGFYVEAGAYDGRCGSCTLLFAERGWRGVLVEPHPRVFENLRGNRLGDVCVNCALVGVEGCGVGTFYCCELMSLLEGARGSAVADREWLRAGEVAQGVGSYAVRVPCRTLNSVLGECGVGAFDLLVLDTEGNELDILRGLDLGRFRPSFILVEVSRLAEELGVWAGEAGFEVVARFGGNWLLRG